MKSPLCYAVSFFFLLEEIEAALSPQESDYVIRVARHVDPRFSPHQTHLVKSMPGHEENEKATRHSSGTGSVTHRKKRKHSFAFKRKMRYSTLKSQRQVVPSYLFDPIHKIDEDLTDNALGGVNGSPNFNMSHRGNTTMSPQEQDSASGKLDQKILDLLKRVGLGLVTISDLSLSITADMKEVILRMSGKAAPKKIGGWFNFEIVRKNIFAVGFTAEQAGFEDFTEKMFNTKLGLFKALEKTTVC